MAILGDTISIFLDSHVCQLGLDFEGKTPLVLQRIKFILDGTD
jgi:hypothetical protein